MTARKISELTALTTPASGDYLPIVDISEVAAADKNKRITIEELMRGVPDGTAAAPSIAFEGDPDTGLFRIGNNAFGISTGGVGRLFVDSSGNVGVGTSPNASSIFQAKAAINSHVAIWDYSATPMILGLKDDGSSQSLRIAGFPLTFTGNGGGGSEAVRIDSSGRLLVGTSSDSGGALLQINGDRIRVGIAKTPASATATGTAGEICWDADYIYVCTATNTWKRSALSTW